MKKNVGTVDKIVRVLIAIVAAYFAYTYEFEMAWVSYLLYAVSAIMLITALTSRCPIFSVFGISSCKMK